MSDQEEDPQLQAAENARRLQGLKRTRKSHQALATQTQRHHTAICEKASPNTSKHARGRLLFDDGSTTSYITSELCERLKLEPLHLITMIINGT